MDATTHPGQPSRPDLGKGRTAPVPGRDWSMLKRGIAVTVSAALAALILTSTLPPLVADQSDRAVVNAPVMLLTAPIGGEIARFTAVPGSVLGASAPVAELVNDRVDRTTLITLSGRQSDARENLQAIRAKRESEARYVFALARQVEQQSAIVQARYEQQILDLKAQVGSADAAAEERKQVLTRQAGLVARSVASPDLVKAASQQFAAARFQKESSESKLLQKQTQLDNARKGLFVGDDVHDLAALIQKQHEMELDIQRLAIEETQVAAAVEDYTTLLDAERERVAKLERATVAAPAGGEVLSIGAAVGRHVTAGDTLARMVDCDSAFVVAIFSYRQGSDLAPGTRVWIDAGPGGTRDGTVMEVLPKTSDKVDEAYAVPFPQTERRELYVLVRPDSPLRAASFGGEASRCDIGRWVTVTRAHGWVPSISVLWREAGKRIGAGPLIPTVWPSRGQASAGAPAVSARSQRKAASELNQRLVVGAN